MKFAHLADIHLGAWKLPELRELSIEYFKKAVEECIKEKVDFVLIAGDLFDIAFPGVDVLKACVRELKRLKDEGIKCYAIQGSHDYSVSGKSIVPVLEEAGLLREVGENGVEETDVSIFGLAGRRRGLETEEKEKIEKIKKELQKARKEGRFAVLMLHTTIKELVPELSKLMPSLTLKEFEFDYCAAGHIHKKVIANIGKGIAAYPSCLFPTSFSEMKDGEFGCLLMWEDGKIVEKKIDIVKIKNYELNADGKTTMQVNSEIENLLREVGKEREIVTLKVSGELESGKPSELKIPEKIGEAIVLRNISNLISKEFEIKKEIAEKSTSSIEEIENTLINELKKENKVDSAEVEKILGLMSILEKERGEEKKEIFKEKLFEEIKKSFLDFL